MRACANIVARIVVSLRAGGDIPPPDNSTGPGVPMDVIEAMISIALHTVARWIWHQKEERGGWVPWLGGVLRGLIVADERQRYWTAPAFDIVEGQITSSLICPITVALVCVSLSFVPSQLQKAYALPFSSSSLHLYLIFFSP